MGGSSGSRADASSPAVSTEGFDPGRKWTPGPWGVEHFGGSIYVGRLRVGEGRSGFEDILYATDCKDYTVSAIVRELANARLIAAAPDLYSALEPFTRGKPRGSLMDMYGHLSRLDFEVAVAAIAKARGQ
jgi:hypothetical protein